MKKMTLREIQNVSLGILKDFHNFCVKNHLTYSLDSGTLIGAVRHQGFIPWDDDIDVIMPRKDYDILCNSYKSEKGYKIISNIKQSSFLFFTRICEMNETIVLTDLPWCKEKTGVWIDIFPIDGADEDENLFQKRRDIAQNLLQNQLRYRFAMNEFSLKKPILYNLSILKRRLELLVKNLSLEKLVKQQSIISQEIPYESAKFWSQYAFFTSYQYQSKSDFEFCVPIIFENEQFFAMNGYDKVLKNIYGNYMELPPENERRPRHDKNHFFWK